MDSLRIPPSEGLRSGDWKYIVYPQTDPVYEELYNLASDPDEERNLAMPHPTIRSSWQRCARENNSGRTTWKAGNRTSRGMEPG